MAKIVTVEQMRRIERAADGAGWSYGQMMLHAGGAVADVVLARLSGAVGRRVLILVGSGNNGGDGLVAGARLREAGCHVVAYCVQERNAPEEHLDRLKSLGGGVVAETGDPDFDVLDENLGSADVVLDAVLGTGFRLPLRQDVASVLARAGALLARRFPPPLRVAVDCPSGLDCDSGAHAPESLAADLTVTLAAVKPGLLRPPGCRLAGEIVVGDIGLKPDLRELKEVQMEMADANTVRGWLPARPIDAHKGTFGKVVIAAGSVNYPGSGGLAGRAAYRVGAGLVCLAVPGGVQGPLISTLPEATWVILPHEMGVIAEGAADVLRRESAGADALLFGPGLGREEVTRRFVERLLRPNDMVVRGRMGFIPSTGEATHVSPLPPLVIDADGLRLLGSLEDWPALLPPESVLTPHPGEMAALTGLETETIQANREGIAREKAAEWNQVVVLKGAHTVVAAPDGRAWVLPFATSALAKAGTGDVLAGAIAGLRAQGVRGLEAAVLAAYLHGRAGILAAEKAGTTAGVLATEVADWLPATIAELQGSART